MSGAPHWTTVQPGETLSDQQKAFKKVDDLMKPDGTIDLSKDVITREFVPIISPRGGKNDNSEAAIYKRLGMGLRLINGVWHKRESMGVGFTRINDLKRDLITYHLLEDDGAELTNKDLKIIIGTAHSTNHPSPKQKRHPIGTLTFTSTRPQWDRIRLEAKKIPRQEFYDYIDMRSRMDGSAVLVDDTKKRYLNTGGGYQNPKRNKKFRGWTAQAVDLYNLDIYVKAEMVITSSKFKALSKNRQRITKGIYKQKVVPRKELKVGQFNMMDDMFKIIFFGKRP